MKNRKICAILIAAVFAVAAVVSCVFLSLVKRVDVKYVLSDGTDAAPLSASFDALKGKCVLFVGEEDVREILKDYPYFYQELIKEVRRKITENNLQNYRFKNPVVVAKESKEDTINYLFGNPIFDENNNQFYKNGMHIIRNCVEEIEQQLKETNCVLIKGRRFSGKTYVILSLCERQKK